MANKQGLNCLSNPLCTEVRIIFCLEEQFVELLLILAVED